LHGVGAAQQRADVNKCKFSGQILLFSTSPGKISKSFAKDFQWHRLGDKPTLKKEGMSGHLLYMVLLTKRWASRDSTNGPHA
jgi:hypothetical protein